MVAVEVVALVMVAKTHPAVAEVGALVTGPALRAASMSSPSRPNASNVRLRNQVVVTAAATVVVAMVATAVVVEVASAVIVVKVAMFLPTAHPTEGNGLIQEAPRQTMESDRTREVGRATQLRRNKKHASNVVWWGHTLRTRNARP